MELSCRVLGDDEQRNAYELGRLAFGGPRLSADQPLPERAGRILWGAFAGDRLVAVVGDRVQGQWFGGRVVPASGISSVSVAAGERGKGYAQLLVARVLAAARERGAAVSTLFPTAPALYRRMGWEETGVLTWWDLPTSALAGLRPPPGTTTRPATVEDRATILALYDGAAALCNGYLARDEARFPGWPLAGEFPLDGVTLAVSADGAVTGFASWERGSGYGADARLEVPDLIGRNADATTALLASIGSWGAVTPTVSIRLARPDPAWWAVPAGAAKVRSTDPWMTRVIDVQAAVAARGWPSYSEVEVDLEITDELCPWNSGRWTLAVSGGRGELRPGGAGGVRLGARGLGVLFAGGASVEMLARGGLVEGDVGRLAPLSAGPAPATLNYF